jgi:heavy metal sensor kinase
VSLPIRVRLTLAFAVAMAAVVAGLAVFLSWRVGRDLMATVDLGLRSRAAIVVAGLREGGPVLSESGGLVDADESFGQVLDPSGRVEAAGSATMRTPLLTADALASIVAPRFRSVQVPRIDSDPVRLLVVPVTVSGARLFVVVGATLGDRRDALEGLVVALAIGGPVAVALASLAGWVLAGAALRPVEAMRREAEAISVSEPERRLSVPPTGDELARLGATLNSMLGRLQASFERERRFVDDASHELRTPLAVLKLELDLALARSRTAEELEAALANASAETDRLVSLGEDLLVLARAENGRLPLHRKAVSLPEELARIVVAFEDRARSAGTEIRLEAEPMVARIDPVRLRQAVENLLDNGVRFAGAGGRVLLAAARDGDDLAVSVEDTGPGFPEELRDRAFEPFVRAESGADGPGAGAGLGLAIVGAVAEAHGGVVVAENRPGGGARVTIRVPAEFVPALSGNSRVGDLP